MLMQHLKNGLEIYLEIDDFKDGIATFLNFKDENWIGVKFWDSSFNIKNRIQSVFS